MWASIIAAAISAVAGLVGNRMVKSKTKAGKSSSAGDIASAVANMATSIGGAITANNQIKQQQRFNASEAQKARDWNLEMDNTKYQRTVADMQNAGVNPALAIDGHLSTQATSNAQAQAESGVNAMIQLINAQSTLKFQREQLKVQKELKNRELNIMQQNANTQEGVGKSTANLNEQNAEAVRINNRYADQMNDLKVKYMQHQVSLEEYLAESARIAKEIAEATKDNEIAIKAQELANLRTLNGVYEAQTKEYNSKTALNYANISYVEAEKLFVESNTKLNEALKKSKDLENTFNEYAQKNKLPMDDPFVVMSYWNADQLEQDYRSIGDDKEADKFAKDKDKIRKYCNKVSQGKMSSKEKSHFWKDLGLGVVQTAGKIAGAAILKK